MICCFLLDEDKDFRTRGASNGPATNVLLESRDNCLPFDTATGKALNCCKVVRMPMSLTNRGG
jgi:hypothetical protein